MLDEPVDTRLRRGVLAVVGTLAMGFGLLVYLADRETAYAALMPGAVALSGGPLFGVIGNWLPSFVHPFAFSLFSAAAGSSFRHPVAGVCAMWWAVNIAFEAGQHPRISMPIAEWLVGTFRGGMGRRLADYFLVGTFDTGDLVAITLGAAAAAGVLLLLDRLEGRYAN